LVQWIDLTSTYVQAAGAELPAQQGRSLLDLMDGAQDWRDWALCEYRDSGHGSKPPVMTTMLRHGQWKLVLWHGDPATARQAEGELYDMAADPYELENLFNDPAHSARRRAMKSKLMDVVAATEDRSAPRIANW
jgi:arylsulfatase A-like enzyme